MRIVLVVAIWAALAGCKKGPQPTLGAPPDSQKLPADNIELPESTIFHTIVRYPGHAGQALSWYAPEMEKRGARRAGDSYVDDNLVHEGGFGRDGAVKANDPTRPGVFVGVIETAQETRIDIWENVPKSR